MKVQQERLRNQNDMVDGVYVRPSRHPNLLNPRNSYNERGYVKSKFPHASRWLKKQFGRPWDSIYSDICNKFLKYDRDWSWEYSVLLKPIIKNGEIYNERGIFVAPRPARWTHEVGYVHPDTGIFTEMPVTKNPKKERWWGDPKLSPVFGQDGQRFVLLRNDNGSWLCRYEGFKSNRDYKEYHYDSFLKKNVNVNTAMTYYGRTVYVTEKRQITSKEYEKRLNENR